MINLEPLHAVKGEYHGYVRWDFRIGDNDCILIEPEKAVSGQRWVWKAEFFQAFPAFDFAMLERGWWIGFMGVGNTFGCPDAMDRFDVFYEVMTSTCGFHPLPVLEGLSRGGLYIYNWAVRDPSRVGLLYADNPVCDFKSWPGGKGCGPGSASDWTRLLESYHFEKEEDALEWKGNPTDHVESLLKAGVPIAHVYGDSDEVVPWQENTGVIVRIAEESGRPIHAERKPGCRHHPHGPENPGEFAGWIISNARVKV